MLIADAISFFGLPPRSKALDDYLTKIGISERPSYREIPTENITKKDEGFSFVFESELGYKEYWGEPREPGDLIFCSLQVFGDQYGEDFSGYDGPLPYGLTFKSTLEQVKAKFGEPTTDHQSGPENWVYVWYNQEGFTVGICFLPENKGVAFLSLERDQKSPPQKLDW